MENLDEINRQKKIAKHFAQKCDIITADYNHIINEIDRIRDIRLEELDVDWDEYKAHYEDTDYDTIITICEEILEKMEKGIL